MSTEQKYHVTYDVTPHPEGIAHAEIPKGHGACDALLVASIIYPADGSLSIHYAGRDGRTGEELAPKEMWKAWLLLAGYLAKMPGLDSGRAAMCSTVFEAFFNGVS